MNMQCRACGSLDNVEDRITPAHGGSFANFGPYCDLCWRVFPEPEPLKFI